MRDAFAVLPALVHQLGHQASDTGHVLLALVRTAPEAFEPSCDPAKLEAALLRLLPAIPHADGEPRHGEVPVGADAIEALRYCEQAARRANATELNLDHLVEGLIAQSGGVAAEALREVGVGSLDDWTSS